MTNADGQIPEVQMQGELAKDRDASPRRLYRRLLRLPQEIGRPSSQIAYVPQVDGIRCLAILIVVLWHGSLRAARYAHELGNGGIPVQDLNYLFLHGEVGVDLFFVISGLVIAKSFIAKPDRWNLGSFYIRRFTRIYPPYLLSLVACYFVLAVIGHLPADTNSFALSDFSLTGSLAASALYMHSIWFDLPSRLNPPMWSLEIEVQFYALAPFLMLAYLRLRSRVARIVLLLLLTGALTFVTAGAHDIISFDNRFRFGIFVYAPYFLAGIAIADLSGQGAPMSRLTPHFVFDTVLVCGALLFVWMGLWFNQIDAHPQGFVANLVAPAGGIAASVMIYVGALYGRIGRRCFGASWIALTGTMCYSIYLTHIMIVQGLFDVILRRLPLHTSVSIWIVWLAVIMLGAFGGGLVFYVFVERPFMGGKPWMVWRQRGDAALNSLRNRTVP
jgi:peptidoglycan/LPS O-acetylase OafA/YrhL